MTNAGCKYCEHGHEWWWQDLCEHPKNFESESFWHGDESTPVMKPSERNANRDCPLFEDKKPPIDRDKEMRAVEVTKAMGHLPSKEFHEAVASLSNCPWWQFWRRS